MRNSRLALAIAGSCASDARGQVPLCLHRRPPRPRHPGQLAPLSAFVAEVAGDVGTSPPRTAISPPRTATSPPPNGGIAPLEARHAGDTPTGGFEWCKSPHCAWVEVAWVSGGGAGPVVWARRPSYPDMTGGNCTNRGATRRRHADRMLLMVQNPHRHPWRHAPSLASCSLTGAGLPGEVPTNAGRASPTGPCYAGVGRAGRR